MIEYQTQEFVKRKIKVAIRDLFRGQLKDVEDKNIRVSRSISTQSDNLPTILIYSTTESVRRFDESPKRYERTLTINVEILEAGNNDDDMDMRLEVLGERVEALMEKDETLGGIANDLELVNSNYQQEPDGESPMGSLVLQYNVEFYQFAIRDDQCLDTLKGVDIDYKVGHDNASPEPEPTEAVDAQDEINFD